MIILPSNALRPYLTSEIVGNLFCTNNSIVRFLHNAKISPHPHNHHHQDLKKIFGSVKHRIIEGVLLKTEFGFGWQLTHIGIADIFSMLCYLHCIVGGNSFPGETYLRRWWKETIYLFIQLEAHRYHTSRSFSQKKRTYSCKHQLRKSMEFCEQKFCANFIRNTAGVRNSLHQHCCLLKIWILGRSVEDFHCFVTFYNFHKVFWDCTPKIHIFWSYKYM